MTYKDGWLEKQLELASKTVKEWPRAERESLSLNHQDNCKHIKAAPKSSKKG